MRNEGRLQRRVLVVDDDAAIRRMLARTLAEDFEIDEAADGQDALALVDRESFDVILLDLDMPRLDGRSFYEALRVRGVQTPVIVISAVGAASAGRELGVYAVPKPFDPLYVLEMASRLAHTSTH